MSNKFIWIVRILCGVLSLHFIWFELREMNKKGYWNYLTSFSNVFIDMGPSVMILVILITPFVSNINDEVYLSEAVTFFFLSMKLLYFTGYFK